MYLSFECFIQALLKMSESWLVHTCRSIWLAIDVMSSILMFDLIVSMKSFSSSLSFLIDCMIISMFSSLMPTLMRSGIWLEGLQISGWSICFPNPVLFGAKKTKSRTKSVFCLLSVNLVGLGFIGGDSSRPKLSAIVSRSLVCIE